MVRQANETESVGYKPPLPAFQIGKALVGKVSARQNLP
jgi:hypothetical protein